MSDKDYQQMHYDYEQMECGDQIYYNGEMWVKPTQSHMHHLESMFISVDTGSLAHYSVVMDEYY